MGRSLSASTSIKSARLPRLPRDDPEVVDDADDELALELTKGHKGLISDDASEFSVDIIV